jgi:hypothetical protein
VKTIEDGLIRLQTLSFRHPAPSSTIFSAKGISDRRKLSKSFTLFPLNTKILNLNLLNRTSFVTNYQKPGEPPKLKTGKKRDKMPQLLSPTTNNEDAFVTPTLVQRKKARSTKSKELRFGDNYFTIITQNVYGLKNEEKTDSIVHRMIETT